MRLLIFTQAIDKNDPVLGFFHGWLAEFSKKFEEITVVALRTGEIALPFNIKVFSINGERNKRWKLYKILKVLFFIWKTRHSADAVFVHMNKEYVLAGAPLWNFFSTPVYFWYNHKKADFFARLAMKFSKKIFYTSEHSASAKLDSSVQMPVGVDTDLFTPTNKINSRGQTGISLGRIDPVKNINILARAILLLEKENTLNIKFTIAGSPSWGNEKYAADVRELLKPLVDKGVVRFVGAVSHETASKFFNQNKVFINLTPSGSFDKTILEAMACGTLAIVANDSVFSVVGDEGKITELNLNFVADKIKETFSLSQAECLRRSALNREFVLKNHSLSFLADRLAEEIQ